MTYHKTPRGAPDGVEHNPCHVVPFIMEGGDRQRYGDCHNHSDHQHLHLIKAKETMCTGDVFTGQSNGTDNGLLF
jgi:hypothetical protein